jgi:hypothetical protein
MRDRADLESIHRFSAHHRPLIEMASRCGCFYCEAVFAPEEITDWVDWPGGDEDNGPGQTALCPLCGIDAVLPDCAPGIVLSSNLLAEMRQHWFSTAE